MAWSAMTHYHTLTTCLLVHLDHHHPHPPHHHHLCQRIIITTPSPLPSSNGNPSLQSWSPNLPRPNHKPIPSWAGFRKPHKPKLAHLNGESHYNTASVSIKKHDPIALYLASFICTLILYIYTLIQRLQSDDTLSTTEIRSSVGTESIP